MLNNTTNQVYYRNQQTHLKLMDWVKKQALDHGSQLLWLEVMDTQQQALRFYKNLGYKIAGDFRLTFTLMHEHLRVMHRMYKLL